MAGLTEADLVARSGIGAERVRHMIEVGVIAPTEEGFRPPDIQLVRVFVSLDDAGIPPEHIAELMRAGGWSNSWADLIFPDPFPFSGKTLDAIAAAHSLPMSFVERLYAVWQLPSPDGDVREDEAEMIRIASVVFHGVGGNEDTAIAGARLFGDGLRRLAESQVRFFRTHVEEPLYSSGMPMREAIDMASVVGGAFVAETGSLLRSLHERHLEHYIVEDVLANLELSMERAGLAQRRQKRPPAIAFLDLTGYTSLTEAEGDEVAAALAESLAEMVQVAAGRTGGRVVKLLGDGVMFHFADPGGAVRCGLDLVEEAPARGLPRARVGVSAGPVIFRDGDYFGRTVNVGARVTDYARPGEVLVTEGALDEGLPDMVVLSEIGEVGLKGLASPVRLFQARAG